MKHRKVGISLWIGVLGLACAAFAQTPAAAPAAVAAVGTTPGATASQAETVSRLIAQERAFETRVVQYQPRVETYLQELRRDTDGVVDPNGDLYFLGVMNLSHGLADAQLTHDAGGFLSALHSHYDPRGFVAMIMPDRYRFNDTYYNFDYQGEEFVDGVRCMRFDVSPHHNAPRGSFLGRIWVEDRGYNIVRFDGTFVPDAMTHNYLHFDSWRTEMGSSGNWLPAAIYVEEDNGSRKVMKAQTRFWGYNLGAIQHSEQTDIQVEDAGASVTDQSQTSHQQSPLAAQRAWERKAEDDVLIRMEKAGLLSPYGSVDKILEQIVTNLEVTNKLNIEPPVRCRVMLTTPLESFDVGHTIVVSRGLLDVLPDEASLAMILAHELGGIVLNQGIDTKYAFDDRMIFPDEQLFQRIRMLRTPEDEAAADEEAMKLLGNSPYSDQMNQAGLFLLAMTRQASGMPNLLTAHMGDQMVLHGRLIRMQALIARAPALRPRDPGQVAALPLGARISLDPWNDQLEVLTAPQVAIISARDKLSFEITPYHPFEVRYGVVATTASRSDTNQP